MNLKTATLNFDIKNPINKIVVTNQAPLIPRVQLHSIEPKQKKIIIKSLKAITSIKNLKFI